MFDVKASSLILCTTTLTKSKVIHFIARTKKTNSATPQKCPRDSNSRRTAERSAKGAKPAAGSLKPPTQRGKSKTLPDPDNKDPDYVELRRGRSKDKEKDKGAAEAHPKSNSNSPRKDSMGFIDPNQIDEDAFKGDRRPLFLDDEAAPLESPNTNKIWSPTAIVRQYIQRSAERAVQKQLAGMYACLVGPRNPDPDNIPTVATAGAGAGAAAADDAAEDVAVGRQLGFGIGIGHDEGIGDD
jgi:hypothetical protein